jgi:phospholipase D
MMAYHFNSYEIRDELKIAKARGVLIRVIQDRGTLYKKVAPELIELGIEFRKNPKLGKYTIFHHKVMIIDDKIMLTGSFNFSKNAEMNNWENAYITNDTQAV